MSASFRRTCFFISDHTGVSAEVLGRALLAQFGGLELDKITLPFLASEDKVQEAAELINQTARNDGTRPIVFTTLINPGLRRILSTTDALVLDFFEPFLGRLEQELQQLSSPRVGGIHSFAEGPTYQQRIAAVNFTLTTDDGLQPQQYGHADVILTGVSRSGKTPTCLYLALHFGLNAANYPFTEEDLKRDTLPPDLKSHTRKLFGLTIDPLRLHRIRSERRPESHYAALATCRQEIRALEALFHRNRIPFLDTSAASIEEIASSIIATAGLKRHAV